LNEEFQEVAVAHSGNEHSNNHHVDDDEFHPNIDDDVANILELYIILLMIWEGLIWIMI